MRVSSTCSTCGGRAAPTSTGSTSPGAEGGGDGARGRTLVNGEEIPGKDTRQLAPGDLVRIETPGGGGFGAPEYTEA